MIHTVRTAITRHGARHNGLYKKGGRRIIARRRSGVITTFTTWKATKKRIPTLTVPKRMSFCFLARNCSVQCSSDRISMFRRRSFIFLDDALPCSTCRGERGERRPQCSRRGGQPTVAISCISTFFLAAGLHPWTQAMLPTAPSLFSLIWGTITKVRNNLLGAVQFFSRQCLAKCLSSPQFRQRGPYDARGVSRSSGDLNSTQNGG